jgi:hypothetical protein
MSQILTIFRGASRLEYRNQGIKLLRAATGEITRSAYRGLWVTDAALAVLRDEPNPICYAVFVDEAGELGLPVRTLMVEDHHLDSDTGNLHLTFRVHEFLRTGLDFDPRMVTWPDAAGLTPPGRFVSVWQPSWPRVEEVPDDQSGDAWRQAVDFLVKRWDFKKTVFFRMGTPPTRVADVRPEIVAEHDTEVELTLLSYNPHLTPKEAAAFSLQAEHSGMLLDVAPASQPIERDGRLTVRVRCIEPGSGEIRLTVAPDFQFSTYLPIGLEVTRESADRSLAYRTLGPAWEECLHELATNLEGNRELHLTVLRLLERAFPSDPSLLFHRGRTLYELGRLNEAQVVFDEALAIRESAEIIAWDLFTSLRHGEIAQANALLERLAGFLSRPDLFQALLDVVSELPSHVATSLLDPSSQLLSEDKAYRLVLAAAEGVDNEQSALAVAEHIAAHDEARALAFLIDLATRYPDWRRLREPLVRLADELGQRDGVSPFIEDFLDWRAAEPAEALGRYRRYKNLLHPDRALEIAMENMAQLLAGGARGRVAALEFGLEAAETALQHARLLTAERAVSVVFANLEEQTDPAPIVEHAHAMKRRLVDAYERLDLIRRGSDAYRARIYERLRPWVRDKTILVLGERRQEPFVEDWDRGMRPRRIISVRADDASAVEAHIGKDLVVVGHLASRHQLTDLQLRRIKEAGGVQVWASSLPDEALDRLASHFPDPDLPARRPPADLTFTRVADVVAYAREHLANVVVGDVDDHVAALDRDGVGQKCAQRTWRALEALDAYADAKAKGDFAGSFLQFCQATDHGCPTVEPDRVALHESDTVSQDPALRGPRTLPVPTSVDPAGETFMGAHIRLLHRNGPAPRLHFYDDSGGATGEIHVGYIGPHLPTARNRT